MQLIELLQSKLLKHDVINPQFSTASFLQQHSPSGHQANCSLISSLQCTVTVLLAGLKGAVYITLLVNELMLISASHPSFFSPVFWYFYSWSVSLLDALFIILYPVKASNSPFLSRIELIVQSEGRWWCKIWIYKQIYYLQKYCVV